MPSVRFSDDVKRQAVELVLHQHLAAADVAQQIGCSVNSIHAWVGTYRRTRQSVTASPPPSAFVPVAIEEPKPTSFEIVTPNGYTIRLCDSFHSLDELLAAIASC